MAEKVVRTNRAPVLTLWAVVVAERLGYDRKEALTLGKCLAGLNAQSKGQSLGIYQPSPKRGKPGQPAGRRKILFMPLMGRELPVVREADHIRATRQGKPLDPESVERYLRTKFGENLSAVEEAMHALANSFPANDLALRAFALYGQFRPEVPRGKGGWGVLGGLDLAKIRSLGRL
ncbi:MAG: hypothetical protein ABSF61_00445 [Anaerolineales bacterium]|jgi:hypothetical protein